MVHNITLFLDCNNIKMPPATTFKFYLHANAPVVIMNNNTLKLHMTYNMTMTQVILLHNEYFHFWYTMVLALLK